MDNNSDTVAEDFSEDDVLAIIRNPDGLTIDDLLRCAAACDGIAKYEHGLAQMCADCIETWQHESLNEAIQSQREKHEAKAADFAWHARNLRFIVDSDGDASPEETQAREETKAMNAEWDWYQSDDFEDYQDELAAQHEDFRNEH